jgi:hypothetical protein
VNTGLLAASGNSRKYPSTTLPLDAPISQAIQRASLLSTKHDSSVGRDMLISSRCEAG